ncbi:MAG: hypothetical protein ACRELF_27395 [Gemmataceae bacterium]
MTIVIVDLAAVVEQFQEFLGAIAETVLLAAALGLPLGAVGQLVERGKSKVPRNRFSLMRSSPRQQALAPGKNPGA